MPSPVMTAGGTAQTTQTAASRNAGTPLATPFRRATKEHREPANTSTYTLSAAVQSPAGGAVSIPAYGYLRGLKITVTIVGGLGTVVFQEDAPWCILQNIIFSEPNGAQIVQFSSGYHLYLAAKYGGYQGWNDPKATVFSFSTTGGNGSFTFYLPLELNNRDGLGSLPNQNAAALFQLRYNLAAAATVFSTVPTTMPTVTVAVQAYEYDQPQASTDGSPNQTTPPAMNTTQYWSEQNYPVNVGANRIRLTRVGNYQRMLGFVYRAATRAAGDTAWPDPLEIDLDARPVDFIPKTLFRDTMYSRYGYQPNTLDVNGVAAGLQDSGVFWYDLAHEFDGSVGFENRDGWWKTYGSTREELVGNFSTAGTLTVLTNDVAVASNIFRS
jgi:hypothetical protein